MSHVIIQWQSDKGKDVFSLDDKCKTGDKVTARYNKLLPAKVLFVGGQEDMERQMRQIEPALSSCTDSPKGRGHRAVKRKQLPDDFTWDMREEEPREQSVSQKNVNPSKKAKSAAGQDIIELLLSQRGSCQDGDLAHSDDRDDGSDDVETKLEFLRRENGILKDRLHESDVTHKKNASGNATHSPSGYPKSICNVKKKYSNQ
ncbi:uncharacterized protein [Apostichopus japonicus]|uniref:uncharacterized protein n=1 Tax=Stichopus japonicus TaxID=307972 RepID=UPI003AB79547